MGQNPERPLHLVIIGLGATGCALLPMVSTLPFGIITVIDGDTIEERNLPRQPLYGVNDLGRPKVEAALQRTAQMHNKRKVIPVQQFVDPKNISTLLETASLVADCTDDLHARLLIDRTCGALGIPLVIAPIHEQQVQALTLHVPLDQRQPMSLQDFFPGRALPGQDGCEMRDVPVHVPQLAAALMARRIHAWLAGDQGPAAVMDVVDLRHGSWMRIAAPRPPVNDDLIA
jgi:molybdopterin/thiamine biosynthesis adenylyltransferase